jgi:hypothetical protein
MDNKSPYHNHNWVRGAFHNHEYKHYKILYYPKRDQKLTKHLHTIPMENLTYLVLNKQTLDNKQTPMAHHRRVEPPLKALPIEPASRKKGSIHTM